MTLAQLSLDIVWWRRPNFLVRPDQNVSMVSWLCKIQFGKLKTDVCWGFCLCVLKYLVPNFRTLGIFLSSVFFSFLLPTPKIFFSCISFFTDCCPFPTSALLPRFPFPGISCLELTVAVLYVKSFCFFSETLSVSFVSYPLVSTLCDFFLASPYCLLKQSHCVLNSHYHCLLTAQILFWNG